MYISKTKSSFASMPMYLRRSRYVYAMSVFFFLFLLSRKATREVYKNKNHTEHQIREKSEMQNRKEKRRARREIRSRRIPEE